MRDNFKSFILLTIFLFSFSKIFSQHSKGGIYNETIQIKGMQRTYLLHLPLGYSFIENRKLPLLIFLHGNGGSGRASAFESKFNRIADREKYIIIYPDGYKRSWNDARNKTEASIEGIDDITFLTELILSILHKYPIDKERIYIGGVSNGGFMAQTMVCRSNIRFAALFSVIATLPKNLETEKIEHKCSVLYILGTKDPFVPYNGGTVAGKNGGEVFSAEETILFWKNVNSCDEDPEINSYPDSKKDNVDVKKYEYLSSKNNTKITLIKIINGGHQYPQGIRLPVAGNMCKDINASEEIFKFLSSESTTGRD